MDDEPGRLRRVPAALREHVEIDPNVTDVFGIPVLRIHMGWGENESAMIVDMAANRRPRCWKPPGAKNIRPSPLLIACPG